MPEYNYTVSARWAGARRGTVMAEGGMPPLEIAAPPEFQGEAGKWTPEHLFMAAIASCFITTFRAIAEFSKFEFQALELAAEGKLAKVEGGFRFTRVVIRPTLTLNPGADSERGVRLLEKAERGCLISRSVNSEIVLEPKVQTAVLS